MTSILHRSPGKTLPVAAGGSGAWLFDTSGKHYLDGSGGAAVSSLGHGHPRVVEAMCEQARKLAFAHTAFFTHEPGEKLAEFLTQRAPKGLDHVVFTSGGSEAIETALKLARQFHVANNANDRTVFIARQFSYHGATLGALSISGNQGRRAPYEPLLAPCRFIAPCYRYRNSRPGETNQAYAMRTADALEEEIIRVGPGRVAAFIAEPVVGATLGAVAAEVGYFKRIREICTRHGVLMVADEVMCGMGRTGTLFAMEQEGVTPDILVMAKGLGGGYQPIGATLLHKKVHDVVTAGKGRFEHGHTYMGHPMATAAALAVQMVIAEEGLLDSVVRKGQVLHRMLAEALVPLGIVGDIRGRGLMIGVELVEDTATQRPFPAELRLDQRIKDAAMEAGLIIYPGRGSAGDGLGDHVLIAPPYIISESEIAILVERLETAIKAALPVSA